MNPLENEPSWTTFTRDGETVYTRPLLGSELIADQFNALQDGMFDVCFGITLQTSLPVSALEFRLRKAIAHLRFTSPLIAATTEAGIHDEQLRSWVYKPAKSLQEALDWAHKAVVILPDTVTLDEFTARAVEKRIPYVLADGTTLIFRCYLTRSPQGEGTYNIFFHGTHAIMDARPTLDAFSLVVEWIANPERGPLESLAWGSEVNNLPVGPVTATGGPRPNWETDGAGLLDKVSKLMADPKPTLSHKAQRTEMQSPGKLIRGKIVFDENQTAKMAQAAKAAGYSVSHVFEAAHLLTLMSLHDTEDPVVRNARILSPMTIFALQRYQVPPHNTKSNFVSALSLLAMSVDVKDILSAKTPRDRLLATMHEVKRQFNGYQANPHLPHVTAAIARLAPPRTIMSNPYTGVFTNVGIVDHLLPPYWHAGPALPASANRDPVIEVLDFALGVRLVTACHAWTVRSKMSLQLTTNDQWDQSALQAFVEEMARQALLIVE